MMTALDERGTSWCNKTKMNEEDDAKEYVATVGAISSIASGTEEPFFIIGL